MQKCNFIYTLTKITAFPVLIFTNVIQAKRHYLNVSSCNEFHHNRLINVASKDKNSSTPHDQ